MKSGKIYILLFAAFFTATLSGCDIFRGEDGDDGKGGGVGVEGPQGPQGPSVAESLPCVPPCLDGPSFADGSVDDRVLQDGAVTGDKLFPDSIGQNEIAPLSIETHNLADLSIGPAQLADLSVGDTQLANASILKSSALIPGGNIAAGAVQPGDLDVCAVEAGDIAPGAVEAGDISLGSVQHEDIDFEAVSEGDIAYGAITSDKVNWSAINQMWTIKGDGYNYTSSSSWTLIDDMRWSWPTEARGGIYFVLFNAGFYYYGNNTRVEVRLVEKDGNVTVRQLARQRLNSLSEESENWTCRDSRGFSWPCSTVYAYGNEYHYHSEYSNFFNPVLLTWVGYMNAPGHSIHAEFRVVSGGRNITQNPGYSDRILTVIEFSTTEALEP